MTWILVILGLAGQPSMIAQAQGYATAKICDEARESFSDQLDSETRKKIKAICLMAPLAVAH